MEQQEVGKIQSISSDLNCCDWLSESGVTKGMLVTSGSQQKPTVKHQEENNRLSPTTARCQISSGAGKNDCLPGQ